MKKKLSLMLALLMLALPVFSGAEAVPGLTNGAVELDYMTKYILQGQKVTVDYSTEFTDTFFAMTGMDENLQTAVKELLSALSFRITGQTDGSRAQGGLAVLLSGDEIVNAKAALIEKNLYATSSLLAGKVIQVTPAQIKQLLKSLLAQMVQNGAIPQELADGMISFYRNFRKDPAGAVMSLIGSPNFEPLTSALTEMASGITMDSVTEAPAELPAAATVITVPVKKEALTGVTTELAKLIWNLPVTQKLAPYINGAPKTEDEMVAAFNKLPEKLAEDTEVKIYADESGSIFMMSDLKVVKGGETVDVSYRCLIKMIENGMNMEYSLTIPDGIIRAVMDITVQDSLTSVSYHITTEATEDGKTWQPMEEIVNLTAEEGENTRSINMDATVRVKADPDAQPTGVSIKGTQTMTDLGDHATETGEVVMGIEGVGDLVTYHIAAETGAAEDYIDTADAVQPLAMSEEELNALKQELLGNVQQMLPGLMEKLPASVVNMFMAK